jgi:DNA-binding LacI/PurR family transcriptional regulator
MHLPTGTIRPVDKRPTIADIARAAQVSIAVVSYTLNGRSGVSAQTRERVLRVAAEQGWRPSVAARSLRSGPQSIGLVLPVGGGSLAGEDRLLQFVTGLQATLSRRRIRALLHVANDHDSAVEVCAEWWAERQVFAVVIPDVQLRDSRIERLTGLGVPVVGLDGPQTPGTAMVSADEAAAHRGLAEYLLSLGHRRLARVTGWPEFAATRARNEAFTAAATRGGATLRSHAVAPTVEAGAAETMRLLQSADRPSAIVYDDDAMAIAALDVARRLDVDVPWELSIVTGADSSRCRLSTPSLTALASRPQDYGHAAAELLLEILAAAPLGHRHLPAPALTVRGSTAPAPR